ncbi:MAG TPA: GNAT family N-acetyltransferase [Symbiobacteriaceae bacterium]|nr:GNAT family N-acetyltransferase [Symbiobacteriaceae bacterium]
MEPTIHIAAPATDRDQTWLRDLWQQEWGGEIMVSRGHVYRLNDLQALLATDNQEPVGAATYLITGSTCELMSLNATVEGRGVGTALLQAVEAAARRAGCDRVWLITSNDNVDALRFYQRKGYRLVAVHAGAIDLARTLKPSIPAIGNDGIPIHDEWELEKRL